MMIIITTTTIIIIIITIIIIVRYLQTNLFVVCYLRYRYVAHALVRQHYIIMRLPVFSAGAIRSGTGPSVLCYAML